MSRVVLGIGSNMGDRLAHLTSVLDALGPRLDGVSSVYETDPVGSDLSQQDYLNAVVIAQDDGLDAPGWLRWAHEREQAAERVRTVRWGPRTLDVDLLDVDGAERHGSTEDGDELTLPHPRAHERGFVLVPWVEVDPAARVPGRGRAAELLRGVDTTGVRRREDLSLGARVGR